MAATELGIELGCVMMATAQKATLSFRVLLINMWVMSPFIIQHISV